MASGELLDEPGDVCGPVGGAGLGPRRQCGQLKPGRPPLDARLERRHECGLQLQPHHVVEERLRLVGGEPEVRRPHLHELATRPQAGQGERRVGPGGHRQRDLWGQVVQEEGHRLVDGGAVDDVVVVERHHRRAGKGVEIVDQADQDVVGRRRAAGLQQRERVHARLGFGGPDRGHEVSQEQPEVGIARVEGQPGHPVRRRLGRRQPLREQGGLPEARRCRDQDQPRPFASVRAQSVGEPGTLHQPATRRRQVQLGAQHRHAVRVGAAFGQNDAQGPRHGAGAPVIASGRPGSPTRQHHQLRTRQGTSYFSVNEPDPE